MFKRIHGLLLAILFFAGSTNVASAQDALAIGAVDYGDSQVALVSGTINDAVEPSLYYFEATDEFGLPQFGFVDIDSYGNFSLLADSSIVQHSFTTLEAVLIDPASGNAAGSLLVVVVVDFNEWFDTWDKNPDGLTEAPDGRPCLYNYDHLKDNYEDIDMTDGDYFPNWPGTTWTEEKNMDFVRVLVKDGGPIRDTFVDDDGLPKDDDPDEESTLDKERKIIEAGGYEWDETIPGWKLPDGYVWDDEEKKWKPAQ